MLNTRIKNGKKYKLYNIVAFKFVYFFFEDAIFDCVLNIYFIMSIIKYLFLIIFKWFQRYFFKLIGFWEKFVDFNERTVYLNKIFKFSMIQLHFGFKMQKINSINKKKWLRNAFRSNDDGIGQILTFKLLSEEFSVFLHKSDDIRVVSFPNSFWLHLSNNWRQSNKSFPVKSNRNSMVRG